MAEICPGCVPKYGSNGRHNSVLDGKDGNNGSYVLSVLYSYADNNWVPGILTVNVKLVVIGSLYCMFE